MLMMWVAIRTSLITTTVFLLGCAGNTEVDTQNATSQGNIPGAIAQLTRPPTNLQDLATVPLETVVQVEGEVQKQAPLLSQSLYQIADDTSTVWVISNDSAPEVGSTLQIQGVVRYEQILVSGSDLGEYYLQETARRVLEATPTPAKP